jgi:RNA polymerase sigma-70 factor (ECF subfamily)
MELRLVERETEPPRELDDVTLARARRGEPAACRALVERYERPVFAVLSRMLRPSGRAELTEDLAQETFLRVFRALPRFVPGGARLSTWILTIATRLAIDELRRKRAEPGLPEVVSPTSTAQGARDREIARALERALAELPPDMRATFVLRAWHGRSHEEIAHALEVELGTVKSRIARARARLQDALKELEDSP